MQISFGRATLDAVSAPLEFVVQTGATFRTWSAAKSSY